MRRRGSGARFANFLIDMVVRTGMTVGTIVAFGEDAVFAPVLLLFGYYIVFEALFARTPAKWITRTRVIALDGSRPRFLQIVGRSFARYVPFEPFSFLGNARGWHDRWSSTRVVRDRPGIG
ncbi:MAG TPA: RDD family protein [Polyangiaceae bacterium]|nr:RDD family protein [Polyangiaceae bacterium]